MYHLIVTTLLFFNCFAVARVISQNLQGSFCGHLKEKASDDPKDGIWLPCNSICASSASWEKYNYVDVEPSSVCIFYESPECDLNVGGGVQFSGLAQNIAFNGTVSKAFKCVRSIEGNKGTAPEKLEIAISNNVTCGNLKEYLGDSPANYLPLVGDSTCNEMTGTNHYHYIDLYSDSKCSFYYDTTCDDQVGDEFRGPLPEIRFESGGVLKSYKCETLSKSGQSSPRNNNDHVVIDRASVELASLATPQLPDCGFLADQPGGSKDVRLTCTSLCGQLSGSHSYLNVYRDRVCHFYQYTDCTSPVAVFGETHDKNVTGNLFHSYWCQPVQKPEKE